jgi:hypothetical protein
MRTRHRQPATTPAYRVTILKDGRYRVVDRDQKNRGTWPATPEGKQDADKHCAGLLAQLNGGAHAAAAQASA